MKLIDIQAVLGAWRFVFTKPVAVLAGAVLYAFLFTTQSWFTALAAAGDLGAAPWGFLTGLLALFAFVLAMASWGRIAFERPSKGVFGLSLGGDEGRLAWSAFLVLILALTVLGTASLAVVLMLVALAVINVEPGAEPPVEGEVDLFALYGPGELAVVAVIFLIFAVFSLWFFLRLAMAYPATVEAGRIKILSAWPLSGQGRSILILLTVVLAALPGVAALVVFNIAADALFGAYPASSQSAAGEAGGLVLSAPVFLALAFVYGAAKVVLVGAPVCSALCSLYKSLSQNVSGQPGF